jgi:hypothetical protein
MTLDYLLLIDYLRVEKLKLDLTIGFLEATQAAVLTRSMKKISEDRKKHEAAKKEQMDFSRFPRKECRERSFRWSALCRKGLLNESVSFEPSDS